MIIDSKQYNGLCSCGKEHKMETEFCLIEAGCLKDIQKYLEVNGLNGYSVAVYDENTYKATADRHLQVDLEIVLSPDNLHANEHGVDLLFNQLPEKAGYLIAVGSGTIHDITRYCAYRKGIDFVSCPTAASVDGFCSSVAAMTWHGCKKTLTAVAPKIVIADTEIIKNAPLHLAKSGFGDMVGKYVALTEWKIARILTGEYYCERIARMTYEATQAVIESIDGILKGEESAYEKLMYGLLMSGLAMQMTGNSRPASGAEHHVSHFIEMKPKGLEIAFEAMHGEKVGVGTLLVMECYRSLLGEEMPAFCDYRSASAQTIESVFGKDRVQDIINENREDVARAVTGLMLREKWQEISQVLSGLPDAHELKALYEKAAIKSCLRDIGVADDQRDFLLKYASLVRNRLTLLRVLFQR